MNCQPKHVYNYSLRNDALYILSALVIAINDFVLILLEILQG